MALRRAIAAALVLPSVLVLLCAGCRRGESDAEPSSAVASVPVVPAEEVLQRMLSAYQEAKSYSDRAEYIRQTVRRDEGVQRSTLIFNLSLVWERPNKLRFKYEREYPPSQRDETFDVASDGQLVRTAAGELPGQVHETLAPAALTVENFIPEPSVREAVLQVSLENIYPQLKMLLSAGDAASVFPADEKPRHLEQQTLRDVVCYRVALDNPAGKRILWIDAKNSMLLRMELPVEAQLPIFDPYGEFSRYVVLIDYIDPKLDATIDADEFALAVPAGAHRMRRLILPPPSPPPAELGRPVAEFSFTTLDGEKVTPESLAGRVALLEFWSQNCPPCREHTPLLETIYQELKDRDDFAFYAVNMDPLSLTNVAASRTFRGWGGTIPILRDPGNDAYRNLGIRAFPHTILISADGKLQYTYSGMHLRAEPLAERIRKLLAGEDLATQALTHHARLEDRYEADLKAAEFSGTLLKPEFLPPEIPARKLPEHFAFEQLWQSSADDLKQPGDIQVVRSAEQDLPRLLVLDAGEAVVEFEADGSVATRHELPTHQEHADGFLRIATDDAGRRWCAASGVGWQQVFVLDDKWQNILTFPEEKHAGIGDVLFANLAGEDNAPLLYIGYWGGEGVQCGTLDGRRAWVNRRLDHVLQIASQPAIKGDTREAWCTSSRGTITRLAPDGKFLGEMSVVGQTLTHVGPTRPEDSGLAGFCGIAVADGGKHTAVGFDEEGEVTWRFELPRGDYLNQAPCIHISPMPGHGACWLVVAADGSLHWLDANGEPVDRCDYGAALTGIACDMHGDTPVLYIATEKSLTAWQIKDKPPEPKIELKLETPVEEEE